MADLVAEVAEQRAVGLRHVLAGAVALGVIGLGDVMVISPPACPVMTRGVSWNVVPVSARKSNARPASGLSNLLTRSRRSRRSP